MQINPREVVERAIVSNISNPAEQIQQVGIDLTLKEAISIPPKGFVNIEVNEKFNMENTFGLITIRSSLSRKGIFLSHGVYDPGFKGTGGVSLYNLSDVQITMESGFRIAQIVVFNADPASMYDGHYNKTVETKSKY